LHNFILKILPLLIFINACLLGYAQSPRLVLPTGHRGEISSISFSSDGELLATGSDDQTAKIWKVATGHELHSLVGHTDKISSVAFCPKGKLVATGSWDTTIKLWEVATGKELHFLEGHTTFIKKIVFSADGKVLATVGHITTKIWDVETGKELLSLKHGEGISLAINLEVRLVVICANRTIQIWDLSTGQVLHTLEDNGPINWVAFSPDGRLVVNGSFFHTTIWEVASGQKLHTLEGHDFSSVTFSPDSKLLVRYKMNSISIWEVATGKKLHSKIGHIGNISSSAFSPDGKLMATGSWDTTTKLWKVATGKEIYSMVSHSLVTTVAFSPNGKLFATGSMDETIKIWEVATGKELYSLGEFAQRIHSISFSPNGKLVVTGSAMFKDPNHNTANIWEIATGKKLHLLKGHSSSIFSVAFSHDSKLVVTGSHDNTTKIWEVATGSILQSLNERNKSISSVAFSPDGRLVVSGSEFGITIWDVVTGEKLHDFSLKGNESPISFSPDVKYIASSSSYHDIKLWKVSNGQLLNTLEGHTDNISSLSFSQNSEHLASGSWDNTIKIWKVSNGQLLNILEGHTNWITSVAFSPDGKLIATGSLDNTVKIWDVATGQELNSLEGDIINISEVAFSPDDNLLTVVGVNSAEVWELATGKKLYTRIQLINGDWLIYDKYYRFDGSESARELLYFVCGLEVIELNQVKDQLYVPGLAEKIMAGDSLAGFPKLSDLDICGFTPLVEEIPSATPEQYHYRITPRKGGLSAVEVYINDKRTFTFHPEELIQKGTIYELVLSQEQLRPFLINGVDNPIRVVGLTLPTQEGGTLKSRGVIAVVKDESVKQIPNLYAVMVGVSDYKDDDLDLNYSAKDATDLSRVLALSAEKLLNEQAGEEHVFVYNLVSGKTNAEPLRENIKNTLAEIGQQSKAEDIVLLFFAGHGVMRGTEEKEFTLLTSEASQYNQIGISTRDLQEWLSPTGPHQLLAQKRILIFDACNSGQANKDLLVLARNDDETRRLRQIEDLKDKSGVFILSASAPDQNAYEFPQFEQGLLTYALLKTLKQNPEVLEEGNFLNVSRWFGTVETEVRNLTRELGRKQDAQPFGSGNINIGLVDEEVRAAIHLAREKPVIASANFLDATGLPSALTPLINNQLSQIAARGRKSSINYIQGNPTGYMISGITIEQNGRFACKVNILKSGQPIHSFEITGNSDELTPLANNILTQSIQWISEHHNN